MSHKKNVRSKSSILVGQLWARVSYHNYYKLGWDGGLTPSTCVAWFFHGKRSLLLKPGNECVSSSSVSAPHSKLRRYGIDTKRNHTTEDGCVSHTETHSSRRAYFFPD